MPDGDLQNICRGRQAVDNHPLMKNYKAAITRRPSRYRPAEIEQAMRAEPDVVLGDILQRTGGVYETTPRLTPKFREDIREIASDDQLRRIAELPEVPLDRTAENLAYAYRRVPRDAPERPSTANDRHQQQPANMKLARALNPRATHGDTLVMRRRCRRASPRGGRTAAADCRGCVCISGAVHGSVPVDTRSFGSG